MLRYAARRLLGLVPTLIGVSFLAFMLIHISPGDPVVALLGPMASAEDIAQMRTSLGLDRPLHEQYLTYVGKALHGDFGSSLGTGTPVLQSALLRIQYSTQIVVLSMALSTLVAVPLGLLAGIRAGSKLDSVTMVVVLIAVSTPHFWLAILMALVFAVWLRVLPLYGMPLVTVDFAGGLKGALMPAIAIGAYHVAMVSRTVRGEMIEILNLGYIRLAKGLGVPDWKVYLKYALKNVMVPVVTLLGLELRYAFGTAPVIEVIFAIPGIGQYLVDGILMRDYPVVQGSVLVLAVIFSAANLVVDLAYAFLDPRIKW